jgi:hypothetical protein
MRQQAATEIPVISAISLWGEAARQPLFGDLRAPLRGTRARRGVDLAHARRTAASSYARWAESEGR